MLRGSTEVTINDSVRAAAAELQRAARMPEYNALGSAPWVSRATGISL